MAFVLKLGARFLSILSLEIHIATTNKAEKIHETVVSSEKVHDESLFPFSPLFRPLMCLGRPQTLPAAAATSSEPPRKEKKSIIFAHERWNRNS